MAPRVALTNFSKGELSPEVESRFDLPLYQAGLRRARNVKIKRTGGVSKRMGTRFVCEALATTARLFPFQFSDDQAYALEFTQAKMRPLALGGAVLETLLAVTAITNATTAKITAAFHGYSVGDQVYLSDIQGMVEINDRFLTVLTVVDQSNFTVDFNSTAAGVFTGDSGGITRTGAPDPVPDPPDVPVVITPDPEPNVGGGGGGGYGVGGHWTGNGLGSLP